MLGEVESEMREGGGGGSTGYGGDEVMGVKYEVEKRVGPGGTCEYTVGGTAVLAASDGGRSEPE